MRIRILLLVISIFSLFAGICREKHEAEGVMTLKEIDFLINDDVHKDYEKALAELNKYFSAYPKEFDAVQKRINLIMKMRDSYSNQVNTLVDVIKNGEEGREYELKDITDRILSLERNPHDMRLNVIKDTNYLVSMYQYSAIQNKTRELVAKGEYGNAAVKAAEGFNVLKENFALRFESNPAVEKAERLTARMTALSAQFKPYEVRISSAVEAYLKALKTGHDSQIDSALSNVRQVFMEAAKIRNEINDGAVELKKLDKELLAKKTKSRSAGNDEKDIYLKHGEEYLSLAEDSVRGWRDNYHPDSGILGAIDAQWNISVEKMKGETVNRIFELGNRFASEYSVEKFKTVGKDPDPESLKAIRKAANCAKVVNGLYALLKEPDGKDFFKASPKYSISVDYIDGLVAVAERVTSNITEISAHASVAEKAAKMENIEEAELNGTSRSSEILDAVVQIDGIFKSVQNDSYRKSNWGTMYKSALEEQKSAGVHVASRKRASRDSADKSDSERTTPGTALNDRIIEWGALEKVSVDYENEISGYAENSIGSLFRMLAEIYAGCGKKYVAKAQSDCKKINDMIGNDQGSGSTRRYAKKAVTTTRELAAYIEKARNVLIQGQKRIKSQYSALYTEYDDSISDSIVALNEVVVKTKDSLVVAEKYVKRAETNRRKGDESMKDSRKSLSRENFDRATDQAYKANDYYIESLKDDYDEEFSRSSSAAVSRLLTDIKEKQKVYIFDEVDAYLAKADDEYRNDNYTAAQMYLSRAQERWNIVFPEIENGEISNMAGIIDVALQANNGRYPTDKLAEISQILSIANQNFDRGVSLSRNGDKTGSAAEFNSALKKLDELKSIAPRNKDANILRLKIQKFQNPEQFEQRFKARVEQARHDYKKKDRQVEVYNELKDLAEMNPKYPGLKELILELEYEMGIKVRITDTGKAESAELLAQAKALFGKAGTDQEILKQALKKADQAIAKYSGNSEAKSLKNRIRVKLESQVVNITFEINEKYQEAMEKYNSYDYAGANEIIDQIWADSRNHTEKIDKLRKRIKAELL